MLLFIPQLIEMINLVPLLGQAVRYARENRIFFRQTKNMVRRLITGMEFTTRPAVTITEKRVGEARPCLLLVDLSNISS